MRDLPKGIASRRASASHRSSSAGASALTLVLDEVDAALDEANLLRFTRFLRSGRQFLLVTHQKRTMEACHALYGVTSEEGVSRVYAIRKEVVHDL